MFSYVQVTLKVLVPVRSPKLNSKELVQSSDKGPLMNSRPVCQTK